MGDGSLGTNAPPPPPFPVHPPLPHKKKIMLNVNQMNKGKLVPPQYARPPGASPPPPPPHWKNPSYATAMASRSGGRRLTEFLKLDGWWVYRDWRVYKNKVKAESIHVFQTCEWFVTPQNLSLRSRNCTCKQDILPVWEDPNTKPYQILKGIHYQPGTSLLSHSLRVLPIIYYFSLFCGVFVFTASCDCHRKCKLYPFDRIKTKTLGVYVVCSHDENQNLAMGCGECVHETSLPLWNWSDSSDITRLNIALENYMLLSNRMQIIHYSCQTKFSKTKFSKTNFCRWMLCHAAFWMLLQVSTCMISRILL